MSKVRNCIELCSNGNEGACRNSCIKSYWTAPARQNIQPDLNDLTEAVGRKLPKPTKQMKDFIADDLYTVTKATAAAAYTPASTPQGVMGQLIPFIVTALGGGKPYVKGHPGTYGQPNVNRQPYPQVQNGVGANEQAGPNRQPNVNEQPKQTEQPAQPNLNFPEQPIMNDQPNMDGQPNMNSQPIMNGHPNMNGQPNLKGQQPGANAQPTMVVPPPPPAVATVPSFLTSKLHKSK